MRWRYFLVNWRRLLTDPVRLYRQSRLERIRLIGGPSDGDIIITSLATRGYTLLLDTERDGWRPEGAYQRVGAGRFQWKEQQ